MNAEDLKKMTIPQLLEEKRKAEFLFAKFSNIQKTKKVQLNSCYGALGNPYFRMFDVRLAESVTFAGQYVIQWITNGINDFFRKVFNNNEDYVIFAHTDSMYIRLDRVVDHYFTEEEQKDIHKVVEKLLDVCKTKIYPEIQKIFERLAKYLNVCENKMHMKIEVISDKGVWDGKNRYALNVYYDEGTIHQHPDIKMVGIETVKSNIPMVCRKNLKRALEIMLREDIQTLRQFIRDFEEEYYGYAIEDISVPISVKGMTKFKNDEEPELIYKSVVKIKENGKKSVTGCPIHTKGALVHNHFVISKGLEKKYSLISDGDKIKYVALMMPNALNQEVIAYKDVLPPEFEVTECVDKKRMFEKTFLNAIEKLMTSIGWSMVDTFDIYSEFGME